MIVVDASVWVSRLVPDDVHHQTSRGWLERYSAGGGECVEPALVLAEVAGAIRRKTGVTRLARQATETMLRLPTLRLVAIDRRLGQLAAQLAGDLALRGADAVYVAAAHHLKIPLVTWDEEQQERASNLISVHPPAFP